MRTLLDQQRRPDEILFVDDASTDDPPPPVRTLATQYPQLVRVIRMGDNVGPGVARNRGIAAACGDFIAFVDVDDQLLPAFLARLMDRIVGSRADVALCGMNIVRGTDAGKPSRLLNSQPPTCCKKAYCYTQHLTRYTELTF